MSYSRCQDFGEHAATMTFHEPLLKISLRRCTKYYINITSYLIIGTMHNTKNRRFVRYSTLPLKRLVDLGVDIVSMIYEQFVTWEAVNWIDQYFQWKHSMEHKSAHSLLERSQVKRGHNPLSL